MAYIFANNRGGGGDTSKGDQAYEEAILSATITGSRDVFSLKKSINPTSLKNV